MVNLIHAPLDKARERVSSVVMLPRATTDRERTAQLQPQMADPPPR